MNNKYVLLFEEFIQKESNPSDNWIKVRDSIQTKRPFVIIIFKDSENYDKAISSELKEFSCVKQLAIIFRNNKKLKYPSAFFTLDRDRDFKSRVSELYNKFNIKQIIIGKLNGEYSTIYNEDGTSGNFGNEVISTISPSEFFSDDHFKVGSTYYRFIESA